MRARVAALATAVLTTAGMLAAFTPGPAAAQGVAFPGASFSGYSTGAAVHADVVNIPPNPRLVDGEVAFSGGSTNTGGLGAGVTNEMAETVATQSAKNSYGRGTGLELGLATDLSKPGSADANQVILAGLAEASAPPSSDLVTKEILGSGPSGLPANPLIYASLLRGQAQARWNPNSCILGAPTDFGLGYAADAQLINTAGGNLDPAVNDPTKQQPLVATDTNPNGEDVVQTKSFTYLRPEPDGTFAVVSEVREQLAPVVLFKNMTGGQITVNVGGEWYLRTISTGKPGGSTVEYGTTGNPNPNVNTLVSIIDPSGKVNDILHVQDLFGPGKIPTQISIPPATPGGTSYLASINVGEKPRLKGSELLPKDPTTSGDGTKTEAAVDVVRIDLVVPGVTPPGQHVAEVRVGHMEANSVAPVGGVDCPIPVSKTASPDPVNAGQDFTWTISIPTAADSLAGTDCDLTNIKATDIASILNGSPIANVTSVSNGGTTQTGTVSKGKTFTTSWDNLGNYHPGGPPIVITINGHIPANSGAGVIQNTVNVTATLGNCKGGAAGQDIVGNATVAGTANVIGAAVKGTATVQGPKVAGAAVAPARLAETGQSQPWLPVAGGGLLLGALALIRSRRRLHAERA